MYPYLLREVSVERVDQVWSCDITYIRLRSGFVCPGTAGHSRRTVLPGRARGGAGDRAAGDFNTDRGAQLTSDAFTALLRTAGVQITMDGRGRALDVFVRAALAVGEVRRGLLEGLRVSARGPRRVWRTTSRSTVTSDRTRRWRIGRPRRCTARFLRWCSPAHRQDADGNGARACGNLADEIPTSRHPSSS